MPPSPASPLFSGMDMPWIYWVRLFKGKPETIPEEPKPTTEIDLTHVESLLRDIHYILVVKGNIPLEDFHKVLENRYE